MNYKALEQTLFSVCCQVEKSSVTPTSQTPGFKSHTEEYAFDIIIISNKSRRKNGPHSVRLFTQGPLTLLISFSSVPRASQNHSY